MKRLAAAAVVVLMLGGTARADFAFDMPWPIQHYIPVRITLRADAPPAGVVLFVDDNESIHRLSADSPFFMDAPANVGWVSFRVYAVPARVVENWPGGVPPTRDWFTRPGNTDCKTLGGGFGRGRVDFNDGRSAVELEYRLVRTGDGMEVVKISENEGSPGYRGAATLSCCCGVPLGIAWLGIWLARRLWRAARRPAAPAAPNDA